MGMFDNLIVDIDILPNLTEDEKSLLKEKNDGWQTKNFENILTDVYIVEDKEFKFKHSFVGTNFPYKLQIKESQWEPVPIDERPQSDNGTNSIYALIGSMRETNIKIVDLKYSGNFNFYTSIRTPLINGNDFKWYEFSGYAENGKIININRVN